MEYLLVFGIALAMTIPLVIIFVSQTQNIRADIADAQINTAATKIIDNAETVYYMGEPSQRTLEVEFPYGVNSVSLSNSMLTINITTSDRSYLVIMETVANITGNIKTFSGMHVIVFKAINNTVVISDN